MATDLNKPDVTVYDVDAVILVRLKFGVKVQHSDEQTLEERIEQASDVAMSVCNVLPACHVVDDEIKVARMDVRAVSTVGCGVPS